jgi:hypothetical protein
VYIILNINVEPAAVITAENASLTLKQNAENEGLQIEASISDNSQLTFSTTDELPQGLALSESGLLTGTPTVYGSYSFNVTISADTAESKTIKVVVKVDPATSIIVPNPNSAIHVNGKQNNALTPTSVGARLSAPEAGTLVHTAVGFPSGLTCSEDGVISGTPTKHGTFTGYVRLTSLVASPAEQDVAFDIEPAAEITVSSPVSISGFQRATIEAVQLQASISDGSSLKYSASGFPAGISCSSSGRISGTPTGSGNFTGTVTVSSPNAESKTIRVNFAIQEGYSETETVFAVQKNSSSGSYTAVGFYISSDTNGTIDWGDGTVTNFGQSSGDSYEHDYGSSISSEHIIRIKGTQVRNIQPDGRSNKSDDLITRLIQIGNSITSMHQTCSACAGLKRIEDTVQIPSGVTSMHKAFSGCSNLSYAPKTLRLPAMCTDYYEMFYSCPNLVADITNWFDNFSSIPSGTEVRATRIFYSAGKITGTVPSNKLWDRTTVTWTDTTGAFRNCSSLSNYNDIPSNWK